MSALGIPAAESPACPPRADARSRWQGPEITVSAALFARFQQLIYGETGIWLSESKTALLCGRLARRIRTLNLSSLSEYYDVVVQPDQHYERTLMIDAITTNETRFFREPKHFDYLTNTVFPNWRRMAEQGSRSRRIHIWSAGCSSGEEAYSLAMLMAYHVPESEGWQTRVLGTDISTRMLSIAREGIYRLTSAFDIPPHLLHSFMLKGHSEHEGKIKVAREIRQMVEFKRLNLSDDSYDIEAHFDAIFCRNVLIYFDDASKTRVVNNLAQHLAPQGLFFIGHAENLHNFSRGLRSLNGTVYTRRNPQTDRQRVSASARRAR